MTKEEKITLLALHGFEPGKNLNPRIFRDGAIIGTTWLKPSGWAYTVNTRGRTSYAKSTWDEMKLDTLPDELLHEFLSQL